jgi:NADPH:quinone reductase-like Zn-dependent oxidoreductase
MPVQIQFNSGDTYNQLKVVEVGIPKIAAEDEVLVKFLLNPINPSDIARISIDNPIVRPDYFPATPGVRYKR